MAVHLHEGSEILVLFGDEWHSRIVLKRVVDNSFIIITPHGHMYREDFGEHGDIDDLRLRPGDRSLPLGVSFAD
eukprot:994057-Karenia_brevis.AAC.1